MNAFSRDDMTNEINNQASVIQTPSFSTELQRNNEAIAQLTSKISVDTSSYATSLSAQLSDFQSEMDSVVASDASSLLKCTIEMTQYVDKLTSETRGFMDHKVNTTIADIDSHLQSFSNNLSSLQVAETSLQQSNGASSRKL